MSDPKPSTCANCGGTFTALQSDQDAVAEAEIVFGRELPPADRATLCDDCYREFLVWFEKTKRESP